MKDVQKLKEGEWKNQENWQLIGHPMGDELPLDYFQIQESASRELCGQRPHNFKYLFLELL